MIQINNKLFILIVGIFVGSIVVLSLDENEAVAKYENIGIAPTDAMHTINVQTQPPSNPLQASSDTLVTADFYDQKIYFVSDGSVIFNVTEAFNSTHAVP